MVQRSHCGVGEEGRILFGYVKKCYSKGVGGCVLLQLKGILQREK